MNQWIQVDQSLIFSVKFWPIELRNFKDKYEEIEKEDMHVVIRVYNHQLVPKIYRFWGKR